METTTISNDKGWVLEYSHNYFGCNEKYFEDMGGYQGLNYVTDCTDKEAWSKSADHGNPAFAFALAWHIEHVRSGEENELTAIFEELYNQS